MTESWILNLPPEHPADFGAALERLAIETRARGVPEDLATRHLSDVIELDYSMLRGFMRGKIHKADTTRGKSLTGERFRTLIEHFWGKPGGLNSPDEVLAWARSGGEDYVLELSRQWFLDLTTTGFSEEALPPPSDLRYPQPRQPFPRTELVRRIKNTAQKCMKARSPLVLLGRSGVGKTQLTLQLEKDESLRFTYKRNLLAAYLGGGAPRPFLLRWLKQLSGGDIPLWAHQDDLLAARLKELLKSQRSLILIDDVSRVEYGRTLMIGDPSYTFTVITTRFEEVAHSLAADPEFVLQMDGLADEEAAGYFRTLWPGEDLPQQLPIIHQQLKGNPLALYYAFHTARELGWEQTVSLLSQKTEGIQPELELIYLPLMRCVETLPDERRQAFRAIGSLPPLQNYSLASFSGLFNVSSETTRLILHTLEKRCGIVRSAGQDTWKLHQLTCTIARRELAQHPQEIEALSYWEARAVQHPDVLSLQKQLDRQYRSIPLSEKLTFWFQDRRRRFRQIAANLLRMIGERDYSPNWTDFLPEIPALSDREYLLGYALRTREKQGWAIYRRIFRLSFYYIFGSAILIFALALLLPYLPPAVTPFLSLALDLLMGLGVVLLVVDLIAILARIFYHGDLKWVLLRRIAAGRGQQDSSE